MKTTFVKKEEIKRKWFVIDAAGRPLGRVAARAASVLRGKHKPDFTPFVNMGDHVIIINSAKVTLSGRNKLDQNFHRRHSGYLGGLKEESFRSVLGNRPNRLMEMAIKRMLPKNSLGREMFRRLRVVEGAEHPHACQKPESLALDR